MKSCKVTWHVALAEVTKGSKLIASAFSFSIYGKYLGEQPQIDRMKINRKYLS